MANVNEKTIWIFFMDKIGNPFGVAGLMGNLYAESGLNPKNLQNSGNKKYSLTDDEFTEWIDTGLITKEKFCKDGYGYGLAQWTYKTRKEKLYNYCIIKSKGSIGDLRLQMFYLWEELQKYTGVLKVLKAAKNVREASDVVLLKFERPANQGESVQKKRAKFGQDIFNRQYKAPKQVKKMVRINRDSVWIRTGPDTSYDKIKVAKKGDTYEWICTSSQTGWYNIKLTNTVNGWITNKFTNIYEG